MTMLMLQKLLMIIMTFNTEIVKFQIILRFLKCRLEKKLFTKRSSPNYKMFAKILKFAGNILRNFLGKKTHTIGDQVLRFSRT